MTGEVLGDDGIWLRAEFLIDTGADRTVLGAHLQTAFKGTSSGKDARISGLGGDADSFEVETHVQLRCDDGQVLVFRSSFAILSNSEGLDFSILGRDVTNLFAIVIDYPNDFVALLGEPHSYSIQ